jgi:hypothetical protein
MAEIKAKTETEANITTIDENNEFVVSDVSDELVVAPAVSLGNTDNQYLDTSYLDKGAVESKNSVFKEKLLQIYNEKEKRDAAVSKKREIPIVKLLKPAYESVSETDKVTFLKDLSALFKEKLLAKKETFDKKFVEDTKGVIKDYKTLSSQLQASIPLLRNENMLRSSIKPHTNLFVFFTDTKAKEKRRDEINQKKGKRTVDEIRELADINKELTRTDSLTNYNYMIDVLKQNQKLKTFTELLKRKSKTNVLYQRLLFLIIMQGYNNDPVDDTSIDNLRMAFNGTYPPPSLATDGGKRKTKKNKIKSKKTRAIKKSKKNITRRI